MNDDYRHPLPTDIIARYRAIAMGGPKIMAMLLIPCLALWLSLTYCAQPLWPITITLVVAVLYGRRLANPAVFGGLANFLGVYWHNNVRGYTAWYHIDLNDPNRALAVTVSRRDASVLDNGLACSGREFTYCPFGDSRPRLVSPHCEHREHIAIGVPLGGWFRTARITLKDHGSDQAAENTRLFKISLARPYAYSNDVHVTIKDRYGDALTLPLQRMMRLLGSTAIATLAQRRIRAITTDAANKPKEVRPATSRLAAHQTN